MSGRAPVRLDRPLLFGLLLAVLALAVSADFARYRLAGSDAGALLTAASKLLHGGVFYRDVDSYAFPGVAYLLAGAMALFGEHVAVARSLAALFYTGSVLALYAAALRLLGAGRAFTFGLALLCFKLVAWPSFTALYYWDVAFFFGCLSAALLLGHGFAGPTLRLAGAGLCVGLATVSKQSLGVPLGGAIAVAILWPRLAGVVRKRSADRFPELAVLAAAALVPIGLMAGAFAAQGLLPAMIESGVLRPFSAYLPTSGTSYLEPLAWWRLGTLQGLDGLAYWSEPFWTLLTQQRMPLPALHPLFWTVGEILSRGVYTSVPLVFGWLVLRGLRVRGDRGEAAAVAEQGLLLFALPAAAIFLSAFPRADFAHVIAVYPPVLLLAFGLWGRFPRVLRWERAAVLAVVVLCVLATFVQNRGLTHRMELDRAALWITPKKAWIESVVRFVDAELPEGAPFFVYGHEAYYYFLTGRYSPWPTSQLYPGQLGGDGGRALVARLRKDPPAWIVRGATRFPRVTPIPRYAPHLDRFVRAAYQEENGVFERFPPKGGARPTTRQLAILRRKLERHR